LSSINTTSRQIPIDAGPWSDAPAIDDKRNRLSESLTNSLMHSYEMPEDDRYSNTARIHMAEEDALR
jgi:hypothetical protein